MSFSQYFINLFARDSSLPPHKVISFMGPIQYTSLLRRYLPRCGTEKPTGQFASARSFSAAACVRRMARTKMAATSSARCRGGICSGGQPPCAGIWQAFDAGKLFMGWKCPDPTVLLEARKCARMTAFVGKVQPLRGNTGDCGGVFFRSACG